MPLDDHDDLLLALHLGQLNPEERANLETAMAQQPELQARSERLGKILRPLDHWAVSTGPASLPEKVLRHISRHRTVSASSEAVSSSQGSRIRFVPMRDLLAAAACLALLVSVMLPGFRGARTHSQQVVCANNLGSLHTGLLIYRQGSGESLPYAGEVRGSSWLPTSAESVPFASNSRHLFLLLKENGGAKPSDFVCPSRPEAQAMAVDEVAHRTDFASARNVSYDSWNLAGASPNLRPVDPDLVYLSDANPLFVGGRFHPALDPDRTNSPAHSGRGQNVMLLGGHSEMLRSPIYGPRRDNLWTIEGVRYYNGTEKPDRAGDAFLVPGFPASDARSGNAQ